MLKKLISAFALALACVCLLQTPEAQAGGGSKKQQERQRVYVKNTCYDSLVVTVRTSKSDTKTSTIKSLENYLFSIQSKTAFTVSALPQGSPPKTPPCVNQSYAAPVALDTTIYILIDCISGARVVTQAEWNAATPCT